MPESGYVPIKNTAQGVGQHLSTLFLLLFLLFSKLFLFLIVIFLMHKFFPAHRARGQHIFMFDFSAVVFRYFCISLQFCGAGLFFGQLYLQVFEISSAPALDISLKKLQGDKMSKFGESAPALVKKDSFSVPVLSLFIFMMNLPFPYLFLFVSLVVCTLNNI